MTELVRQRLALDQLQDERSQSVALLDAVDRADVRMIQRREEACLALEAREAIRIGSERCGQDLDGDIAPKLRIARPIHFAHAACPERAHDFVRPELRTGAKHHMNPTRAEGPAPSSERSS